MPKDLPFPHIKDWISRLNDEKNIPQKYREKACLFGNQILETSDSPTLLYGDLHHENILQDQDEWLIINPLIKLLTLFSNYIVNA